MTSNRLTRRSLIVATGAATVGVGAAALPPPLAAAAAPGVAIDAPALPPALKPDVFRDRQARLRSAAHFP